MHGKNREVDFGTRETLGIFGAMINVALVEPEIPPNTGNIARLCAATGAPLHIIGATGFRMDDRSLKRAGLDYWSHVTLERHFDFESFESSNTKLRLVLLTTKAEKSYLDWNFEPDDCIVFGRETKGLPDELLEKYPGSCVRIPMPSGNVRSLNLATSVGIVLYEALRQTKIVS
jgi:tRNA (cytidine/uridine-2'-O-)-methyltransferase